MATRTPPGPVVRKFTFAYNTAGLTSGISVYTPAVGEILLDAFVSVATAWNAAAVAGVGTFTGTAGLPGTDWNLQTADTSNYGAGQRSSPGSNVSMFGNQGNHWVCTIANPLKLVVSLTGAKDAAASAATAGAATLYLITATPV